VNGYPAAALPPAHIAWPILVVLVLEYVLWPFLTQFVPDEPRCPLCKTLFRWSAIDTYDKGGRRQPRPFSFPCPTCQQTIGVPSWRKSFLRVSYLALIATFFLSLRCAATFSWDTSGVWRQPVEPYGLQTGSSGEG